MAVSNAQGPFANDNKTNLANTETKATSGKFTGHWFIKSGEDFYLVRSGNLPPGLVNKTTDNKVEDIDVEGVKRAVNFRKESHIDGKPVDNYYFVIEEDGENSTGLSAPAATLAKKGNNNSITEITANEINGSLFSINRSDMKTAGVINSNTNADAMIEDSRVFAIKACPGIVTTCTGYFWKTYNPCTPNNPNNVFMAYPEKPNPTHYYVICGATN